MKRRWIAVLLLATACSGGTGPPPITVEEQGSSRHAGTIAVAAKMRVRTAVGLIRLRLTFRDADGRQRDSTTDSLPYCTARTECWWGASFPLDQFDGADEIRTTDVTVIGTPRPFTGASAIAQFDVSRQADGRIHGTAPGDEGFVYVIAFEDGVRGGVFTSVVPGEGRTVTLAPSDGALLGPEAELHAYFYPTRVPRGD